MDTIAHRTKRKRHTWPETSTRRTEWYTIRTCSVCGLEKWTDHNDRFPLTYFKYNGVTVGTLSNMPECEIVE